MSLIKGELSRALVRTTLARGLAAVGSLVFGIILARLYGAAGVGLFALAQSVILGASILARFGLGYTLTTYVGRECYSQAVRVYLRWAVNLCLLLSSLAACLVLVGRSWLAALFDSPDLSQLLVGLALAIPPFTLAFVLAGFMKAIRKPATASLMENGSIAWLTSGMVLGAVLINPESTIVVAAWSFCLAAWLILAQGLLQATVWLRRNLKSDEADRDSAPQVSRAQFMATSRAFSVMNLATFMHQALGVMIAGLFLSPDELGLFKTAEKVALLIHFILVVVNAVFPPRFAESFHKGDFQTLERLARHSALIGVTLAFPLFLGCLLLPRYILGFFGPEFIAAAHLLQILALAQMVSLAAGSVGCLLNMTGHEKSMRNIAIACNGLGLLFLFILIPLFDATGAAVALALVLVLQNLTALVYVWRRLGIWTLPIPNILRLMGMEPQNWQSKGVANSSP